MSQSSNPTIPSTGPKYHPNRLIFQQNVPLLTSVILGFRCNAIMRCNEEEYVTFNCKLSRVWSRRMVYIPLVPVAKKCSAGIESHAHYVGESDQSKVFM